MNEYAIDPQGPNYKNITEAWPIYDTIVIDQDTMKPEWFQSYVHFASQQNHSFFNVRNRGEVGDAYTNMETKDQMPFVYHIYSIGLQFIAPPGHPEPEGVSEQADDNFLVDLLWCSFIQNHVGLKLRVREDEKLLSNGMLLPPGSGPSTFGNFSSNSTTMYSVTTGITPGMPTLSNRFNFPRPIEVPRGATFSVEMILSQYAQVLCNAMPGPTAYNFDYGQGQVEVNKQALIRCSLFGKRAVQQRGELHY